MGRGENGEPTRRGLWGAPGLQWSHATAVARNRKLDIPTGISPIVGFKSASDEQRARIRRGKDWRRRAGR